MQAERWKVFLDTSALMAGVVSPSGAAREVLRLCEAGIVDPVVSRQVLTEADRNLSEKLPALVADYRALMRHMAPVMVKDPSRAAVERAARVIHRKDAPILAAARDANVDYLITWDTKHFLNERVSGFGRFKVVTPGEFLRDFRRLAFGED
jgi:predicted nucleic acid-binding protein